MRMNNNLTGKQAFIIIQSGEGNREVLLTCQGFPSAELRRERESEEKRGSEFSFGEEKKRHVKK